MNRLIRLWNQNRKECIAGIVIIIAIWLLIQLLNMYYANTSKIKNEPKNAVPIYHAEEVQNVEIEKEPTAEMSGNGEIGETAAEQNVEVMKNFIQYCNERNVEAAYNLLATETKTFLFSNIQDFEKNYIQAYFQTRRGLDYELWKTGGGSYTYKITLLNDALAEGTLNTNTSYIDYFTIVAQDGYWKLNLGGLIRYTKLDKTKEDKGTVWNVIGKEVYMNYEVYTIKVTNRSGKTILLDSLQDKTSIFATGNTGTTYSAFLNEIPMADIVLKNYGSSTFKVKFNKIYNSITTQSITFSQVITDYETYIQTGEMQDVVQIEIAIE